MQAEVIALLACRPGGLYVDGTVGGGGHAAAILEASSPGGRLIGLDQDPAAIARAARVLEPFGDRVRLVHENFARLGEVLAEGGVAAVDGIVLDLGVSLDQLESSGRGFSFRREEPLDMRMDPRGETTAADLLARLGEEDLAELFHAYGEERHARRIARAIVRERPRRPLKTTADLVRLLYAATPGGRHGRIHPATRVFMALRIAVNRELERLEAFLDRVPGLLRPGGRVCILAFHSLEDRIVKQRFRALAGRREAPGPLAILTRRPLRPQPEEIAANPLARSARLRAAVRV